MSVLQSQYDEVRYLKRKGLEEESRIIGNALRDQIRQYGIDCVYYKLDESFSTTFKNIIDRNTILKRAYGYEINPDYSMSVDMITYADAQQDLFMMNKLGFIPNAEIDFNFDKIDFACALATKCGQLKEYEIDRSEIICEVPSVDLSCINMINDDENSLCSISCISSSQFPFEIGFDAIQPKYTCGILSGNFRALIPPYRYGKTYTIVCDPYEHTNFNIQFPANSDLYRSLKYKIENDDYLETLIYLTYRVDRVKKSNAYGLSSLSTDGEWVNVLSGYVHGSILFYDVDKLGKYVDLIRPAVGDIVEIDFPDDRNREKYEITDCFDKQLTQDGISPLLHKYIWKCKARRYINSYEDNTPQSEADDRIEEINKYNQAIDDTVSKDISMYDNVGKREVDAFNEVSGHYKKLVDVNEDAAYGGYDGVTDEYDKQTPGPYYEKYDFIDDGTAVDLIRFGIGSRILTNGYDLLFMTVNKDFYQIATNSIVLPSQQCMFEQNLRWLKATDSQIVFINVEGESTSIACDYEATKGEIEVCLNSLYDKTLDDDKPRSLDDVRLNRLDDAPFNKNYQNFYKFKGTRTYLWSDGMHLYAKLASNKLLYKII